MSDTLTFTNLEKNDLIKTLKKRWKKDEVALQQVDVDIQIEESTDTAICPAFYWQIGDYHFLVLKTGKNKYRPQFFYQDNEEVGAETGEFDDLSQCAMTLLQLQADYALSQKMADESN